MKKIRLFTRLIDIKPGDKILYNGIWYTAIDVLKTIIEPVDIEDASTLLTITMNQVEEELYVS